MIDRHMGKICAWGTCHGLLHNAHWLFAISLCCVVICFLVYVLSDEDKIELAVINPAYVMGPVLNGSLCTSSEVSRSNTKKVKTHIYKQHTYSHIILKKSDLSVYMIYLSLGVCYISIPGMVSLTPFSQEIY